jgi:hypothetical protein
LLLLLLALRLRVPTLLRRQRRLRVTAGSLASERRHSALRSASASAKPALLLLPLRLSKRRSRIRSQQRINVKLLLRGGAKQVRGAQPRALTHRGHQLLSLARLPPQQPLHAPLQQEAPVLFLFALLGLIAVNVIEAKAAAVTAQQRSGRVSSGRAGRSSRRLG